MPNTRLQPIIMKSPTGMPDFGVKVNKIQNLVSFSASTGWVTLSELLFFPCNGRTGQSKVPLEPYNSHKIFHICIQNAVGRNSFFQFPLLYLFWSLWACLLTYRNVTHHFGINRPSLRNDLFVVDVLWRLHHTLKMRFNGKCQKNLNFSSKLRPP